MRAGSFLLSVKRARGASVAGPTDPAAWKLPDVCGRARPAGNLGSGQAVVFNSHTCFFYTQNPLGRANSFVPPPAAPGLLTTSYTSFWAGAFLTPLVMAT